MKIYIIYKILHMDLYLYVKSILRIKLSTNSNLHVKLILHTDFHIRIYIKDIIYRFNPYIN